MRADPVYHTVRSAANTRKVGSSKFKVVSPDQNTVTYHSTRRSALIEISRNRVVFGADARCVVETL